MYRSIASKYMRLSSIFIAIKYGMTISFKFLQLILFSITKRQVNDISTVNESNENFLYFSFDFQLSFRDTKTLFSLPGTFFFRPPIGHMFSVVVVSAIGGNRKTCDFFSQRRMNEKKMCELCEYKQSSTLWELIFYAHRVESFFHAHFSIHEIFPEHQRRWKSHLTS